MSPLRKCHRPASRWSRSEAEDYLDAAASEDFGFSVNSLVESPSLLGLLSSSPEPQTIQISKPGVSTVRMNPFASCRFLVNRGCTFVLEKP